MSASVCEHCERQYLPATLGQRWCSSMCIKKWHKKRNLPRPHKEIIRRACKSCNKAFRPLRIGSVACSTKCMQDIRKGEMALPCLRCKHWVVDSESDSGGWCNKGRWRICKPYLPENRVPYAPLEE